MSNQIQTQYLEKTLQDHSQDMTGKVVIVPAGTLDEAPDIKPIQNIYWDSRADWHVETSELVKFAELPDRPKK